MTFLSCLCCLWLAQAPAGGAEDAGPVEVLQTLGPHDGDVYAVAITAEGDFVATAGLDGVVTLWNARTGERVGPLARHDRMALAVTFSPDGRLVASGGEDKIVRIWTVPRQAPTRLAPGDSKVATFAVAPGGSRVLVARGSGVEVVQTATGQLESLLEGGPMDVRSVATDALGSLVAAAGSDGGVRVWKTMVASPAAASESGAPVEVDIVLPGATWKLLRGKQAPGEGWAAVDFDAQSWEAAAAGFGYSSDESELSSVKTRLTDMPAAKYLTVYARVEFNLADPAAVRSLHLKVLYDDGFVAWINGVEVARANVEGASPAFDKAASSAGEPVAGEFDLQDAIGGLRRGRNVLAIQGHNANTGSSDFVLSPSLVANLETNPLPARGARAAPLALAGATGNCTSVAVSGDGSRVAVGTDAGRTWVWSLAEPEAAPLEWACGSPVRAVVFLGESGQRLAVGSDDGVIRIRNLGAEDGESILSISAHDGGVRALAWSRGLAALASGGADGRVKLWTSERGEPLRAIDAHEGSVLSLSISSDDTQVISGGVDGTLRVTGLDDGVEVARFRATGPVHAVAERASSYLGADGGNEVFDWRIPQTREVHALSGHGGYVQTLAFNDEGSLVASAGQDKTVRLWDPVSGKQVRAIDAHEGPVFCVAFSRSGELLASGGYDKTIRIWKVEDGSAVRRLEGHEEGVSCLAFRRGDRELFSGSSDRSLRRWSLDDGTELSRYSGHDGWVIGLVLIDGGEKLLSVDYGGQLSTWAVADGSLIGTRKLPPVVYGLAATKDGTLAVTANPARSALVIRN